MLAAFRNLSGLAREFAGGGDQAARPCARTATLTGATALKLCRLRYVGSAHQWQFAIYRASHDDYDESIFLTGLPIGTRQDVLDTACGLYLNDPTAWA